MKLRKKHIALISCLSAITLTFTTGCSTGGSQESSTIVDEVESVLETVGSTQATSPDEAVKEEVESAIKALDDYQDAYMVSASISMPSETTYYLEVNDENGSYTQYSMDEQGNLGKVSYEESNNTNFMLFDWITPEGKGYLVNQNYVKDESSQWLVLPQEYSKSLLSRKSLYLNELKAGMSDFKKGETIQADLGKGDVDLQLYTCTIKSDVVADVIGIDTLGLYEALEAESEAKNDENVKKLTETYIDELEMNLVFSDAKATIGVYEGVVRYLQMEVGGLGSRMKHTKIVLEPDDTVLYDTPNFESQESYYVSIKELADYVAEYDSYEEAMSDLYGKAEGVSPNIEETEPSKADESSSKKSE